MTGNASDVGSGALKGAAIGSAAGPYGAAAGAIVGGAYGYLSGGPSDAEKAAADAAAAHVAAEKRNAVALENYRQSARDQYHQLLVNETTPYQAYSNRLAAGWGQGMSTAGLSSAENPLTLRDTGVGAPEGSNYAGYTTTEDYAPGKANVVYHQGIGAYLNGANIAEGDRTGPNEYATVPQGNGSLSGTNVHSVVNADPLHAGEAGNTSLNPTYNSNSMGLRPGGGPSSPGAGFQFRPRGA